MVDDEGPGELDQAQVVLGLLLVADAEFAEAVMPAVRAFNDPATLPLSRLWEAGQCGMWGFLLSSQGLGLSRSARVTGSSQWGQRPPGPIRRQNCWHSGQRCSPRYRAPHA